MFNPQQLTKSSLILREVSIPDPISVQFHWEACLVSCWNIHYDLVGWHSGFKLNNVLFVFFSKAKSGGNTHTIVNEPSNVVVGFFNLLWHQKMSRVCCVTFASERAIVPTVGKLSECNTHLNLTLCSPCSLPGENKNQAGSVCSNNTAPVRELYHIYHILLPPTHTDPLSFGLVFN